MSEPTSAQWERINQLTSEFHGICDFTQARRRFLHSLRLLVEFDLADFCLTISDLRNQAACLGSPVVVSRFTKEFEENFTRKYESEYGSLDYTRWFYSNRESVVYRESDVIRNEVRQNTPYYLEYLKPMDLIHVAGISISSEGTSYGVITLYRKSSKLDFSDDELALLQKLVPHLLSRMQREQEENKASESQLTHALQLSRHYHISRREGEVLDQLLLGKTNNEIAEALHISAHTVKKHVGHLFTQLQVTNRAGLIRLVMEQERNSYGQCSPLVL